jgi:SprT protein
LYPKPSDDNAIAIETQKQIDPAIAATAGVDGLIELARAKTRATLERALDLHVRTPAPISVEIRFDLRGKSAGQVRIRPRGRYLIRYNLELLRRGGTDFLTRTVPHEVAHVIAHHRYGSSIQPHGPEWRAIMHDLGADASRCHNYDVSGLTQRRLSYFDYQCGCMSHRLSSIRHNRIAKGQRYLCRRCGEPLRRAG